MGTDDAVLPISCRSVQCQLEGEYVLSLLALCRSCTYSEYRVPHRGYRSTMKNPFKLLSLETLYLRWASDGKSPSEIATIEGGNLVDIRSHLDRAILKLGAASLPEAINRAKELKII